MESLGGPGETLAEIRERANAAREVWNQGGPEMAVQSDIAAPGPFRDVPMRLYKPTDVIRSASVRLFARRRLQAGQRAL